MEKKHKCKICNKRFPNGRALGGHMRSHLAKLPVPPQAKPPVRRPSSESSTPSDVSSVPTDFDCASETSTPSTNPRPNKRLAAAAPSSASDTNPEEEDVAFCLLMMSRDSWTGRKDHDRREDHKSPKTSDVTGAGGGYRCETCDKTFRSGQALGGHRASHRRRTRVATHGRYVENVVACGVGDSDGLAAGIEHQTYECPFCFKVFESGQALGGHKKVHPPSENSNNVHDGASVASSAVRHNSNRSSPANRFIDLNLLPASVDDNNDDSVQFADFSVVSQVAMDPK